MVKCCFGNIEYFLKKYLQRLDKKDFDIPYCLQEESLAQAWDSGSDCSETYFTEEASIYIKEDQRLVESVSTDLAAEIQKIESGANIFKETMSLKETAIHMRKSQSNRY